MNILGNDFVTHVNTLIYTTELKHFSDTIIIQ